METARVLILDDDVMVGELLQDMLGILGYCAQSCASPVLALELIEKEHFEIILSDFHMPQMTGEEFFNEAVARDASIANRIIFLTGDAGSEETEYFLKSTGSLHLSKPFHLTDIKKILERAIENNRHEIGV